MSGFLSSIWIYVRILSVCLLFYFVGWLYCNRYSFFFP